MLFAASANRGKNVSHRAYAFSGQVEVTMQSLYFLPITPDSDTGALHLLRYHIRQQIRSKLARFYHWTRLVVFVLSTRAWFAKSPSQAEPNQESFESLLGGFCLRAGRFPDDSKIDHLDYALPAGRMEMQAGCRRSRSVLRIWPAFGQPQASPSVSYAAYPLLNAPSI